MCCIEVYLNGHANRTVTEAFEANGAVCSPLLDFDNKTCLKKKLYLTMCSLNVFHAIFGK